MSLQGAISQAIRVQATREGISLTSLSKASGMSATSFFHHLNNRGNWNSQQITRVARSLNLGNAWGLLDLARSEEKSPQEQAAGNEVERK